MAVAPAKEARMYKLYNVKTWGSVCVHLLLEEMEVPYTNIWMTEEQVKAQEFREISPLGFIPALGLPDGRSLFESAAIVTFLVTAHPEAKMAPPVGTADFGEFLSWLNFMSTNIYPTNEFAFPGSSFALNAEQDAHIVNTARDMTDQQWAVLERRLETAGPWLMGEDYSALDIYAFMLTLWGRPSEAELHARFPRLSRLASEIRLRPKLKAALEAHGVLQLGGYHR
jgi:glutathione S-transferase